MLVGTPPEEPTWYVCMYIQAASLSMASGYDAVASVQQESLAQLHYESSSLGASGCIG